MDLMRPNLAPGFQPCFVLETMRRYAEEKLDLAGVSGRNSRVVKLDSGAPVNNIKVIHFGRSDDLGKVPLRLKPWDVRWIEIE